MGRKVPRNTTERYERPHGTHIRGHCALKSTFFGRFFPFSLIVSSLPLPSDQYRTFRRFRNAPYWSKKGRKGREKRTEKHYAGRQFADIPLSNPHSWLLCLFFSSRFLLTSSLQPIPGFSAVSERSVLVGRRDKGESRAENGQKITTSHHGTPREANLRTCRPQLHFFSAAYPDWIFSFPFFLQPVTGVWAVSKRSVLVGWARKREEEKVKWGEKNYGAQRNAEEHLFADIMPENPIFCRFPVLLFSLTPSLIRPVNTWSYGVFGNLCIGFAGWKREG